MSLRDEDLVALDEFAAARRLTRGDAVGVLLEAYAQALEPKVKERVVEREEAPY